MEQKLILSNLASSPDNILTISLGDLVFLFIIVSIGNVGFNEWLKATIKSIREKAWTQLFCGIVNLIVAIVAGISIKLILYPTAHPILTVLLVMSALAVTQLTYQTIIQGLPDIMNSFFGGFKEIMVKMVTQSVCTTKEEKK